VLVDIFTAGIIHDERETACLGSQLYYYINERHST
jgi:hypothetical protein